MPPSGPTTSRISPVPGSGSAPSAVSASGSSTIAHAAAATRAVTPGSPAGPVTSGNRARRACLPASRAVDRHRAERPVAALPRPAHHAALCGPRDHHVHADLGHQLDRQLAALPLGNGLGHGHSRVGGRDRAPVPDGQFQRPALGPVTTHSASWPAPSVRSTRSPAVSLRTSAACRPSGPDSTTWSPASSAGSARNTGGRVSRGRPPALLPGDSPGAPGPRWPLRAERRPAGAVTGR